MELVFGDSHKRPVFIRVLERLSDRDRLPYVGNLYLQLYARERKLPIQSGNEVGTVIRRNSTEWSDSRNRRIHSVLNELTANIAKHQRLPISFSVCNRSVVTLFVNLRREIRC